MTVEASAGDPTAVAGRRIGAYAVDWLVFMTLVPAIILVATADPTMYTAHLPDMTTCDGSLCDELSSFTGGGVPFVGSQTECEAVSALTDQRVVDPAYGGLLGCLSLPVPAEGVTLVWRNDATLLAAASALAYLILVLWVVQGLTGATVGKMVVGVRTIDDAGRPPGLGRQLLRGTGGIVDAAPYCLMPFLPVVGLISMFASKRHQRIGDMLARTTVVRVSSVGAAERVTT